MKRAGLWILLIAVSVALFATVSVNCSEKIYEASGPVVIDLSSGFFTIGFRFFNGSAQFGINGPNIQHDSTIASLGRVIGTLDVTSTSLNQAVNMLDGGTISSQSLIQGGEFVALVFDGVGFTQMVINTDELNQGSTRLLALLDAQYIWIYIKDDHPEPPGPTPRLRVLAVGNNGSNIRLVIKNYGSAPATGDTTLIARLSYKAMYWLGDFDTELFRINFGKTRIKPGEIGTYDFTIPNKLPSRSFEIFFRRRGLFDSFDYPSPPEDCFNFCLEIGGKPVNAYLPVNISRHE